MADAHTGKAPAFLAGEQAIVGSVILLSLLTRLVYVFYFTDYANYLNSDAGGYWERALRRYRGEDMGFSEWWIWPTAPHFFLAGYFRLLEFAGLENYRLPASLAANALASSVSVYFFYRILKQVSRSFSWAMPATVLYAFFYPYIYFNAFILSETPAITFFLIALDYALRANTKKLYPFMAGIFLILAATYSPAYSVLGLPFALYIFWRCPRRAPGAARSDSGIFVLACVLGASTFMWVNYTLSRGENYSFTGRAGGINLFMKQCNIHKLAYREPGLFFYFVPAQNAHRPELAQVTATQPFHRQGYYYRLAGLCIAKNPHFLAGNIASLKQLFFGNMYPSAESARGFSSIMPVCQVILFFLAVLSGFAPFILFRRARLFRLSLFLSALAVLEISAFIAFNTDHRHIYSIGPVFLILPVLAIRQSVHSGPAALLRRSALYLALCGSIYGVFRQGGYLDPDTFEADIFTISGTPPAAFAESLRQQTLQPQHILQGLAPAHHMGLRAVH